MELPPFFFSPKACVKTTVALSTCECFFLLGGGGGGGAGEGGGEGEGEERHQSQELEQNLKLQNV
jgi:hypothetical protein